MRFVSSPRTLTISLWALALTTFALGACRDGDEPTRMSATVATSTAAPSEATPGSAVTTSATPLTPITSPEGEVVPPPLEPTAGSLLELMHSIDLPWTWNGWSIEPYERYETTFVNYDGDFVFVLEMYGHDRALPAPNATHLRKEEIISFWQGHMNDPSFDEQRDDYSHTIESVQFLSRPALLSVWFSPASGPAERSFIELWFQTGQERVFLSVASDHWEDTDAEVVAAFLPAFKMFIGENRVSS